MLIISGGFFIIILWRTTAILKDLNLIVKCQCFGVNSFGQFHYGFFTVIKHIFSLSFCGCWSPQVLTGVWWYHSGCQWIWCLLKEIKNTNKLTISICNKYLLSYTYASHRYHLKTKAAFMSHESVATVSSYIFIKRAFNTALYVLYSHQFCNIQSEATENCVFQWKLHGFYFPLFLPVYHKYVLTGNLFCGRQILPGSALVEINGSEALPSNSSSDNRLLNDPTFLCSSLVRYHIHITWYPSLEFLSHKTKNSWYLL